MKKFGLSLALVAAFLLPAAIPASAKTPAHTERSHSVYFTAENRSNFSRADQLITLDVAKIIAKYPSFNEQAFEITTDGKAVPSQVYVSPFDNQTHRILFLQSFGPEEKKTIRLSWIEDTVVVRKYRKLTRAVLGMKVDYSRVDGYYTGGKFVDVDSSTVPADHFAHDALYRIEGPGWESDKIVYRYYLDSRNRNDIFGKKIDGLVLQKLGVNDLVSDSKESYTKMLDWGMDIFKVGESLGIGSIAMWHDSRAVTVSDVGRVKCYVAENGPVLSGIYTKYTGWKVGDRKYDLYSHLTICGGSRLTRVDLRLDGPEAELCTGLADHPDCDFIRSSNEEGWNYIALYGKQSLSGDDLGIAVFYKSEDAVEVTRDSLSRIVVLRPEGGRVTYYFAAAWQEEPGGIKNEKEFRAYLKRKVLELNDPVLITL